MIHLNSANARQNQTMSFINHNAFVEFSYPRRTDRAIDGEGNVALAAVVPIVVVAVAPRAEVLSTLG